MKRPVVVCLIIPALLLSVFCFNSVMPVRASLASDLPVPEVDQLIRQLGDDDFATREAATWQLMTRQDAVPALRRALESPDKETARRAANILEALAHSEDKRALAWLEQLGADGAVDQAAELLVRRPKWYDEVGSWQVMSGLAAKLMELEQKEYGKKPRIPDFREMLPAGDFRAWAKQSNPNPEFLVSGRVVSDPRRGRGGPSLFAPRRLPWKAPKPATCSLRPARSGGEMASHGASSSRGGAWNWTGLVTP